MTQHETVLHEGDVLRNLEYRYLLEWRPYVTAFSDRKQGEQNLHFVRGEFVCERM